MRRILQWLILDGAAIRRSLIIGAAVAVLETMLLLLAATMDGTYWLPAPGIGLLQHPGIAAIIVADFAVLSLAAAVARKSMRLGAKLPIHSQRSNRRYLRRVVNRIRGAVLLSKGGRRFFLFCAGVGFLFWIANGLQTLDPVRFYGRDVFDSYQHSASYFSFRFVLGLSWLLIYPYCATVILTIAIQIYLATRTLAIRNRLCYRTFHPDHSGGFSVIGDISFLAIMAMMALYAALATVILTHQKLNILQISGFLMLSVGFLLLTFLVSWPTVAFLFRERRTRMLRFYRASRTRSGNPALVLIWLSTVASFSPYASYQRVLINTARLAPVAIAVLRVTERL